MMIMDDNIVLYDREAAVEYARTYALVYNKDYPNFDRSTPNSGDCMNFCFSVHPCWRNASKRIRLSLVLQQEEAQQLMERC